jgi:hypothetical protein
MNGWPCRACGTRARTDRGQRSEKSFRVNGPAGAGRSGSSPVSAVSAPFGQSKADPRVVVSPKSENNSNTSTPRTEKLPRHYASPSHWQEGGTSSSLPRDQLAGGDGVHLAEPPAIPRPRRPPPPPPPAVARVRHGGVPPPRRPPQARPRHPPRPMVQPGTHVPSSPVPRLERRWPDACALCCCCCCLCTLQGTAFSMTERDRLGLRGLLPPSVVSSQQQIDRFSTTPPIPRLLLCVSLVCCCPKLDCSVLRREVFWLTMTRSFHF